ncbi:hypothetical protein Tco_1248621 [Tanacetum coccineum]
MTNEREGTPPPDFSTLTPLPDPNVGELPLITISTFTTRTPENTPLTNHASTSANPNLAISPTFIEANYEVLESLLRECRRLASIKETTLVLRTGSLRSRRQRGRVVEFEDAPNRDGSRVERESEGRNENNQPLQSTLTSAYGGHQPSNNSGGNLPLNGGTPSFEGALTYHPYRGYVSQAPMSNYGPTPSGSIYPSNALPNNSTGCVTPFVHWIKDYPLPYGLKMPSHVGSYIGKRDADNYLHLFEGAIRMQKWEMPVACPMFTYTLKDSTWI